MLSIKKCNIQRSASVKRMGVIVDKHLSQRNHINIVENKVSKNLGLLCKLKNYLNQKVLLKLICFTMV